MGGAFGSGLAQGIGNAVAQGVQQQEDKQLKQLQLKKISTDLDIQKKMRDNLAVMAHPDTDEPTRQRLFMENVSLKGELPTWEHGFGYAAFKDMLGSASGVRTPSIQQPNLNTGGELPYVQGGGPIAPEVLESGPRFPIEYTMPEVASNMEAFYNRQPTMVKEMIYKKHGIGEFSKQTGTRKMNVNGIDWEVPYGPGGFMWDKAVQLTPEVDWRKELRGDIEWEVPYTKQGHLIVNDQIQPRPLPTKQERVPITGAGGQPGLLNVPTYKTPPQSAPQQGYPPIPLEQMAPRGIVGPQPGQPVVFDNNMTQEQFNALPIEQQQQILSGTYAPVSGGTRTPPPSALGGTPRQQPGPVYYSEQPRPQASGLPPGAIPTGPGTREKYLKGEDLQEYIDPITGKPPTGNWSEDSIDASGKFVRRPKNPLGMQDAARLSTAIKATPNIDIVKNRLFPKGQLDREFATYLSLWYNNPEKFAGTEAAEYGKKYMNAISAQVRLETGATKTETEQRDAISMYSNQLLSTPEAVIAGIDQLKGNLLGTINIADPTGYYRVLHGREEKYDPVTKKKYIKILDKYYKVD
jgi:hypothetical protein